MRIKHIFMLLSSLLFVVICFVALNISSEVTGYERYEINITDSLNSDTLLISTKNDAKYIYQRDLTTGDLFFEITQPNQSYDEIVLNINCANVSYDTSKLEEILGDNIDGNEKYLEAFKNGPWEAKILFSVAQYNEGSNNKGTYTIVDTKGNATTHKVANSVNSKMAETEMFVVKNGDRPSFDVVLGSKFGGALESGIYYIKAYLVIEGLYEGEGEEVAEIQLSLVDKVMMFFKVSLNSIKEAGFKGIISVTSIWELYGTILLVGMVYYFWKDGRSAFFIGRKIENFGVYDGLMCLKEAAFCGQYANSDEMPGFFNVIALILGTAATYAILVLTLPIRVAINIVRDLIGIVFPLTVVEKVPNFGNLIGSLATFAIFLGFVIMFKLTFWIGLIFIVVGAVLTIPAHKVTKNNYFLWDY